jgi:hypothetical protein
MPSRSRWAPAAHGPDALSPCPTCGATNLRLYKIAEAAELFDVGTAWFYERIADGLIHVTELGGGAVEVAVVDSGDGASDQHDDAVSVCPVPCDADCDALCHEDHEPWWKRTGCAVCSAGPGR